MIITLYGIASASGAAKPVVPRKGKSAIFGLFAYLIMPIDIFDAKRLFIIGWLDEVASLSVLVQKMSKYITSQMKMRVDDQLDKWFPRICRIRNDSRLNSVTSERGIFMSMDKWKTLWSNKI